MSVHKAQKLVTLRLPRVTWEHFKRYYPDHGDMSSVMKKLLRGHLAELDERGQRHVIDTESPLPVVKASEIVD